MKSSIKSNPGKEDRLFPAGFALPEVKTDRDLDHYRRVVVRVKVTTEPELSRLVFFLANIDRGQGLRDNEEIIFRYQLLNLQSHPSSRLLSI